MPGQFDFDGKTSVADDAACDGIPTLTAKIVRSLERNYFMIEGDRI